MALAYNNNRWYYYSGVPLVCNMSSQSGACHLCSEFNSCTVVHLVCVGSWLKWVAVHEMSRCSLVAVINYPSQSTTCIGSGMIQSDPPCIGSLLMNRDCAVPEMSRCASMAVMNFSIRCNTERSPLHCEFT